MARRPGRGRGPKGRSPNKDHKLVCARRRSWPTIGTDERCPDRRLFWRREVALAAVLARRGLVAIDSDDDPFLARLSARLAPWWRKSRGTDLAWLARHSWAWDPVRLDELIRAAARRRCTSAAVRTTRKSWPGASPGCSCWRSTSPRCWRDWMRAGTTTTGAVSGTPASFCAASCRHCRTACGIGCDPHRRQAAPRPGGGRDTRPHAVITRTVPRTEWHDHRKVRAAAGTFQGPDGRC